MAVPSLARVLVERLVDDAKQHGADMATVFVSPESTWVTLEGFADRSAERRASGKLNDKTAAPRRRAKRSIMDTELPCELIERTQL
jgi:hypothetical protein